MVSLVIRKLFFSVYEADEVNCTKETFTGRPPNSTNLLRPFVVCEMNGHICPWRLLGKNLLNCDSRGVPIEMKNFSILDNLTPF